MKLGVWYAVLLVFPLLLNGAEPAVTDPFVLADPASSSYYLYTGGASVEMYKSEDLVTWEGPKMVFTVPEDAWAAPSRGVSAPEVVCYRGRYFLFATLENPERVIDESPDAWRRTFRRGTQVFMSESPEGPFNRIPDSPDAPVPPADFMTRDGTLFVEGGIPYMVYAHDWEQRIDGTMEAVELTADFSAAAGEPFYLFKGSDAPWLKDQYLATKAPRYYPTASPQTYRTRDGKLLLLWSSLRDGQSVQTIAYSLSGEIRGPWRQAEPILGAGLGHGAIFETFDDRLVLVVGHPGSAPSAPEFYELEDMGDTLRVRRPFEP